MNHKQLYWFCQCAGWFGMVGIETINYTFFIIGKFSPRLFSLMVLYAVMGMLCTHGYWYFLKKSDHFQKKGIRIWLSAFMATVVISTILSFVNFIPMANKSPTMNFQVMENILDADKLLILAALGATIFSTITEDGGTGGDDMATLLLMTA